MFKAGFRRRPEILGTRAEPGPRMVPGDMEKTLMLVLTNAAIKNDGLYKRSDAGRLFCWSNRAAESCRG